MNINLLFEQVSNEQTHVNEFNKRLYVLDEKKRKLCTINPTDSPSKINKKCRVANAWGVYYAPLWSRYVQPQQTEPIDTDTSTDTPTDSTGDVDSGEVGEIQGTRLIYPNSIGPDDDEEITNEAMTSTERMRRYNRRHPEKVRKYLRDTVKDRVKRNRDRAKAVKKHGKKKMKNHDVHHPNGPNGGTWRLAKKDHGRDKKENKD